MPRPTLNASAFAIKQGHGETSRTIVHGSADGLPPIDDVRCGLVADTWTVLFANSFAGMGTPGNDPIEAAILCARLTSTFAIFTRTWLPWRADSEPNGQPPAGEPCGIATTFT